MQKGHQCLPMNHEYADEFLSLSGVVMMRRNLCSRFTVKFFSAMVSAGHGLNVWPSSCPSSNFQWISKEELR